MRRELSLAFLSILLPASIVWGGCSSTSNINTNIPTPVGLWTYVIPSTPQGEAYGTLMVAAQGEGYSGEMYIDLFDQTVPIEEVAFTDNTLMFKATLDAGGQLMGTAAHMTLSGDTMNGTVAVEGVGDLEITATRSVTDEGL